MYKKKSRSVCLKASLLKCQIQNNLLADIKRYGKKIAELLEAIIMIYRFCYESFSGVLSLEEYQKIKTVKYKNKSLYAQLGTAW